MAYEVTSFQLNLGDRQRALIELGEPHFEAHLAAIMCLLRRNEEADRQVAEKMDELAEQLRNTDGGNQADHAYLGTITPMKLFMQGSKMRPIVWLLWACWPLWSNHFLSQSSIVCKI